jgi:AcrR family transcriptional regulator
MGGVPFDQRPDGFLASTRRERLMVAFGDLVLQQGFEHLRYEDVACLAGCSVDQLHDEFPTKDECLAATYRTAMRQSLIACSAAYARASGGWESALVAAVEALLEGFASTPVLVHLLAVVAPDAGPVGRMLTREVPLTLSVFLRPGYEEAGGPEALPPLEALAEIVIGGGFSTVRAYAIDGRAQDLPELLEPISLLCLAPLIGREAALRTIREHEREHRS